MKEDQPIELNSFYRQKQIYEIKKLMYMKFVRI